MLTILTRRNADVPKARPLTDLSEKPRVPAEMPRSLVTLLIVVPMIAVGVGSPALGANVAVIMSSKVDDYREALRGFKDVAKHRIVAEYDMDGDPEKGPSIVADVEKKVKPDLIFAVGIWALQAVLSQPTTIPVVYAMVLNPPSVVGDGKNVTGASMNVPVEEAIRLFKQLGIKRVGTIFTRTRTGYLVKRAESLARHEGLQLVTREITSPKEITAALESLQDGIDALWILPDETTLTQPALQQMLLFSYRRKIPVLGLSERHAQLGALFALSFASSEDIGRQAAELALAILSGTKATEIPYTTPRQVSLTVNLKTAGKLGIEVPKTILGRATSVIQ
jgi:putative tryptophan/tyrosine transport system substrate-binding protein